jgi:antitoxin ParD1/3/4
MTIKTTLSFTERHHRFLMEQVQNGVYATASAGVAAAIEEMMRAEEERRLRLSAYADVIRERAATSLDEYVDEEDVFGPAFAAIEAARK